ncbi:prepilin-type N-terminal cleavage/methylation domain-containing protein [Enterobacteriaceae bacterium LUAb1]
MVNNMQSGFSLFETLLALLLFALTVTLLLRGQQAVTAGSLLQMQQRQAWRLAAQRLEGPFTAPEGWQIDLIPETTITGCQRQTAEVISPAGRRSRLQRLKCDH